MVPPTLRVEHMALETLPALYSARHTDASCIYTVPGNDSFSTRFGVGEDKR
jgi:hypothetical protein